MTCWDGCSRYVSLAAHKPVGPKDDQAAVAHDQEGLLGDAWLDVQSFDRIDS
ncbi:MAG: hypothetical protein AB8B64_01370 [Granulosicoccus sp.]